MDDTTDGVTLIKRFKKEKFPQILVSVNMLDTGFDCPEVVNLVFARFTRSAILYQQMRGRGTRKAKGKPLFTMFDFVGVADEHEGDDEYAEGGKVMEPAKTKPEAAYWRYRHQRRHRPHHPRLGNGGRQRQHGLPRGAEAKATELGARFEAWLVSHEFTPEQERWLHDVEAQIRANADAFDAFTLDHLEIPPFSGRRRAAELFGGEDNLSRVVADLSQSVYGATGAH